ncbi:unnamed protein product [Adineta steineri]|uniref:PLAT domain-containing protein n=1 Tax=Adineta steineri TaxID=433720 RepID=A0A813QQL6_9BILA|nr:unnamed protein product [Adineta steineri]
MIFTSIIYIILMIYARFKDKKDIEKLGVTPLADNNKSDHYYYQILVFTGQRTNAGTDSKVYFVLSGNNDQTHIRLFSDPHRKLFQRGGINSFIIAVPKSLGLLNYIRIWHDNTGEGSSASWFLKYIIVRDLQTLDKSYFISQQWFAVEKDDGRIERILPIASEAEMQEFSYVLSKKAYHSISDGHLWFSIFSRPPSNKFTRVQRCTCCFVLFFTSMLINIMYYDLSNEADASSETHNGALSIGPFYIAPQQIGIGIMVELFTLIPSLLIVQFFRRIRPRRQIAPIREALYKMKPSRKTAVFIQLTLYNPSVQLLTAVTLLAECLPTGGIYTTAHFEPINFYTFTSILQLVCTILYIFFIIYFIIIEIRLLFELRLKYFHQFWSIIQLGIIGCSLGSIGVYFWRFQETNRISQLFEQTNGYVYINLQLAVYVNDILTFLLGYCCFFSTIKFIELFRFNRRISLFAETLKSCAEELISFSIMFAIVFISFLNLFYLLFVSKLSSCSSLLTTAQMLFEMTLVKCGASQIVEADAFLGPFCFTLFIFLVVFVCLSLKKLNQSEVQEERDCRMRSQYVDSIDIFSKRIDQLLGAFDKIYVDQQAELLRLKKAGV